MSKFIGVDYYGTLGLNRDASTADLNAAFRKLALKNHPNMAVDSAKSAARQVFSGLCEAYVVLSNTKLRSVYDMYGHDGLSEKSTYLPGGFKFDGDADKVFRTFFGSDTPLVFADTPSHLFFSERERSRVDAIIAPLREVELQVTLSQTFNLGVVPLKFTRRTLSPNLEEISAEQATVNVSLIRGLSNGSGIVLRGQGDVVEGHAPGDLIARLVEEPHATMRRGPDGAIILRRSITVTEALCGAVVDVTKLDGRSIRVAVGEVTSPGFRRIIDGEGAWRSDGRTRGALIVEFDVRFPLSLSSDQKDEIRRVMSGTLYPPAPVDPDAEEGAAAAVTAAPAEVTGRTQSGRTEAAVLGAPGRKDWPDLVGRRAEDAARALRAARPELTVKVVAQGAAVGASDVDPARAARTVRIEQNAAGVVVSVPRVG